MDRRSFLRTSALGGSAAAASTLAAPAYAQGKRTLTMVTTWGRGLAGVHDAAQRCADTVTAMSDGALTVEVKAAGELVGAFEVFDAVSSGQADMYHGVDYYFLGQHPAFSFFSAIPFGMTAQELNNWYYHQGGQQLQDQLTEIFGLKTFLAGNTGPQSGGWFRKEINGPEDFQGLKFRMPGQGGEVLAKLGASVQNLPGGEVYQALASGAIDGTEWIGPWADEKAGFQEITKFYYTAGFHEPGPGLSLATNREVYDSLSPALQSVIENAAMSTNAWSLSQFMANNASALQRLQAGGVKVLEFPDSVWDAFGSAAMEVVAANLNDDLYKEIHDSYMASMRNSSQWISRSEGAYSTQRNRILG
ncbi:MAG: ABC transporter substrate-binding protein [Confluentimicrobium sp.]|mgnify:CR=1 FL=1|jgi:TRAP-type mannitol/chloroaromatic compound transport system substrate-binding protein|uniref:TRAP transporter substrate-binding protein n=1 Tax=unclassified Actibacterium TaxID=2649852 RepID=UPI0006C90420|nr:MULTISPECIES: TRAP transporter substrate-binding protein [unclassified Actibacterium]ALG90538.1 ABC transporter substrate-binding protein [Actibacterium sp. EMB200-NS6]MBC57485.1 ABC transporter substrate-binding protein [Actibacterium sp.]